MWYNDYFHDNVIFSLDNVKRERKVNDVDDDWENMHMWNYNSWMWNFFFPVVEKLFGIWCVEIVLL